MDIDTLWNLADIRERTPQWHSFYIPGLNDPPTASNGKGGKKRLAITSGDDYNSDSSMPSLQTVSDSSEADSDSDVSEEFSEAGSDYDDESDWDTDEEEDMKDMMREAMNIAMGIPDFTDTKTSLPEFDALAAERKDNAFLKLLGSLRGEHVTVFQKLFHEFCANRSYVLFQPGLEDPWSESASKAIRRWKCPNP